jgi:hypothetical protein
MADKQTDWITTVIINTVTCTLSNWPGICSSVWCREGDRLWQLLISQSEIKFKKLFVKRSRTNMFETSCRTFGLRFDILETQSDLYVRILKSSGISRTFGLRFDILENTVGLICSKPLVEQLKVKHWRFDILDNTIGIILFETSCRATRTRTFGFKFYNSLLNCFTICYNKSLEFL